MGKSRVAYCPWCTHKRYVYERRQEIVSDGSGPVGVFVDLICYTCNTLCEQAYAPYVFHVIQRNVPYLSFTEHGPYKTEYEAKLAVKELDGIDVEIRKSVSGFPRPGRQHGN